jgi:signal transduction histidine kinase/ligand-binding sensor domain-containing protein
MRVRQLNVDDGLSQSSVYSILQDSYGFIWMATGDGLNRYDGKQFVSYKSTLSNKLPNQLKDRNINSHLFEDRNRNLWFTADEGVYCMNRRNGTFNVLLNKHETRFAGIITAVDSDAVWVAVPEIGVHKINILDGCRTLYRFGDTELLKKTNIIVIRNGVNVPKGIWIADTKGLNYFDKSTGVNKRILDKEGLNSVYMLQNGNLILGQKNGVEILNTTTGSLQHITIKSPLKEQIQWRSFAEDTALGYLYAGEIMGGTICKLNLKTYEYSLDNFQDSKINMMFIDRSRNMWVGTDGAGVFKIDIKPEKFKSYVPKIPGGTSYMVKSVYRDEWGKIWMGVFDKGIVRFDPVAKNASLLPIPAFEDGNMTSKIECDSNGDVVVSVDNKMLWLEKKTGKLKQTHVVPSFERYQNLTPAIYSFTEWSAGRYLVGTNMGLYSIRKTGKSITNDISHSHLVTNPINGWIYNLHTTKDGYIYIGKRNGFSKIRIANDTVPVLIASGLDDMPVRHFYKSEVTPILWIATEQGLVAFNEKDKSYTVFDERTGMPNSFVYAIVPENDSTLWISTNKGLSQVRIHYGDYKHITAVFTNFTSDDGLQSNEFNTGAFYKCTDGTIIFGGIAGINWFKPQDIQTNPYIAIPSITSVYVNDTLEATDTVMYMKKLTLPYTRNTISFTIRALEYTLPQKNGFAYMLKGLDRDWVYTGNDKVRYSNLAPGEYTFMLKVKNNENLWNETPLEMEIIIRPPFWQTLWFRALLFALFISGIFSLARYYAHRKVTLHTRELERKHALNMERLRISKDVHDDLGSGLSKISLLSEIAHRKIIANQEPGNDISSISAISKELVDNMHDLIWVLNPENVMLDNLVSRIREYCADYLDGVGLGSKLNFPESVPSIETSQQVQKNIFSTLKEAINNSIKHAGASEIDISLRISNSMLHISVRDNGSGFTIARTGRGGNGLRNMKQRMETIGGDLAINSVAGSGTEVEITIGFDKLKYG